MRALLRRPKVWIAFLTLAILGLLLFLPIKNVLDVTAVQNAVQRDWEIDFIEASNPRGGPPAMLSASLDADVWNFLFEKFRDPPDTDDNTPTKMRMRNEVYYARFQAFFRGTIEEIRIDGFEAFSGDLGAALARFPHLRRVTVTDNDLDLPTEAEWTKLCAHLRALPHLESIELGGAWITDAALAPLSGHPHLRSIIIAYGRYTEACAKTFATIPHLTTLLFEDRIYNGDPSFPSEEKAAIRAALPGVIVKFPRPPAPVETPPADPQ